MKFSVHPKAKEELIESINYYERCSSGLGVEFAEEIYSTINRIIRFPIAWTEFSKDTRRCLTNRFPFGVVYQIHEDENQIIIIAVMQLNKAPGYWKNRI